jgi:hypothetical protein
MARGDRVRELLEALSEAVREWCRGRHWIWRAPILLYLAYAGVRHLGSSEYTSLFGGINLGIHELGHVLTSWAGQWISVLGGTLFQCLAPIVSALLFLRQPDFFAVPVCGWWLGDNLYGVATYMADARALELPLVTVGPEGGEVEHDWNYLLDSVGLLQHDTQLAALVRVAAFLLTWSSIAAGAWMCWRMARGRR